MANHKSALKRARQSEIKRIRNKSVKTRMKNVIKKIRLASGENSDDASAINLDLTKSVIDTAARKGVIHKKTASRKISRISKLVNSVTL
ncbi:MAG TPA: 30S ribosomal protein S20 [Desulfobacteraceae bacterium]|nr:30S ribosomal protein S20 [Desulfobacteraceae bacterium]